MQSMLNRKQVQGLSDPTVPHMRSVLRIALNRALRWGLVTRNVAALADPPRIEAGERRAITEEDARAVLGAVRVTASNSPLYWPLHSGFDKLSC